MKKSFTQIPNAAIDNLRGHQRNLYIIIARNAFLKGYCYKSQPTLMDELPISRPTLKRTTKELVDLGWILITQKNKSEPYHYYPLDEHGQLLYPVKNREEQNEMYKEYGDRLIIVKKGEIKVRNPVPPFGLSSENNNDILIEEAHSENQQTENDYSEGEGVYF